MRWSTALLGLVIASLASAQMPTEQDYVSDEAVLKGMGLPTKGADLLKIFRDRTPTADTITQFNKHVKRLASTTYAERAKANADLVKMGPVVRPLLESLIANTNQELETKRRLQMVLEQFPAERDIAAVTAASRLLERDKPAKRLEALLDFIPHATNELVRQDVQRAINGAALDAKEPAPLIESSLKDENPARRAAAAEALIRAIGPKNARGQVAPLMKDASPLVRYQLGFALVEKHDKLGLPLLIRTVAEDSPERVEYALELLQRAAGDAGPSEFYEGKKNAAKVAAAWSKWLEANDAKLDLAKLPERVDLGHTVIAMMPIKVNAQAKIVELGPGPQRAVRWEFDGPRTPLDVQVLGPNRLLIAAYSENRVIECDHKGKVLKQFPAQLPIACQRIAGGNTFIATRRQLQIVDPDGKEVFSWTPQPNPFVLAAQHQKNGQIAVLTQTAVQLLDPKGQELKRFNVPGVVGLIGINIEVLPNGRVLVPLYNQQEIAEFDWTGNKVWRAPAPRPLSATRVANGNTLVTTSLNPYRVIEIDREGREVWSHQTEGRPYRARRR